MSLLFKSICPSKERRTSLLLHWQPCSFNIVARFILMFPTHPSLSPTSTIQVPEPQAWKPGAHENAHKYISSNDNDKPLSLENWHTDFFEQDAANPKNWPKRQRITNSLLLASISLLSSFASSIVVPATPDIMSKFQVKSEMTVTLLTSLYVLGLGVGPFILAPLSEIYGRRIIYTSTLTVFTCAQLACSLVNSMTWLIIFRLISGITGGIAPSLGQASLSDVWDPADRGQWAATLTVGAMFGPPLGNFVAAIILQQMNLTWIFWILTICSTILLFLSLLFLKESYAPVILERRQKLLQKSHQNNPFSNGGKIDMEGYAESNLTPAPSVQRDPVGIIYRAITRPWRFLGTSPIVIIFGFFLAYTYGIFYVILTSLPLLFGSSDRSGNLFNYGFTTLQTGVSYWSLIVGFSIGFIIQAIAQPWVWKYLTERNGESRPEYRLLPMTVGMLFFPTSLLMYGWSAERQSAWIVPEIALALFAIGQFMVFQSIQIYLAEAFIPYSASAIAAATLLRAITGAVFPLFADRVFTSLGYGLGGTVLSIAVFPAIPLPWILYRKGDYLRKRWEFKP